MSDTISLIYIRTNKWWEYLNICKCGYTTKISQRDGTYVTSEPFRGNFTNIWKIITNDIKKVEKDLHNYLIRRNFQFYYDGGTEFFNKDIDKYVTQFFDSKNIDYIILTMNELYEINRNTLENNSHFSPYDYQQEIIKEAFNYFQSKQIGIIKIPCGTGKTLISLWIAMALECKKILISVPKLEIMDQWIEKAQLLYPDYKIYKNGNGNSIVDDIEDKTIIVTTYCSSHKLKQYKFNIIIHDEMHHLTGLNETEKNFKQILNIESNYKLFLTATLKSIINEDENLISNDNTDIFGDIIVSKPLSWALDNGLICEYGIETITCNNEDLNKLFKFYDIQDELNKKLFLSAYISLQTIVTNKCNHLLIYCNKVDNCNIVNNYIKLLIENNFSIIDLYHNVYTGCIQDYNKNKILINFKNHRCGIISCAYCLSEGWDLPLLGGVIFAENMTSNIRIIQAMLRPCRLLSTNKKKVARIIIPTIDENWLFNSDSEDYKKIKQIIYSLSEEDENIREKITTSKAIITMDKTYYDSNKMPIPFDDIGTQLLKTRFVHRMNILSFNKAKEILATKKLLSYNEYYLFCNIDNRFTPEPNILYKTNFANWMDYLSIQSIYYNIDECKEKINQYIKEKLIQIDILDLESICKQLYLIDANFPPSDFWCDYYNIDKLSDIFKNIKKVQKKKTLF